jgi:hypothetical protein
MILQQTFISEHLGLQAIYMFVQRWLSFFMQSEEEALTFFLTKLKLSNVASVLCVSHIQCSGFKNQDKTTNN